MNFFKRGVLSIIRKPSKSLLLFMIVFLLQTKSPAANVASFSARASFLLDLFLLSLASFHCALVRL